MMSSYPPRLSRRYAPFGLFPNQNFPDACPSSCLSSLPFLSTDRLLRLPKVPFAKVLKAAMMAAAAAFLDSNHLPSVSPPLVPSSVVPDDGEGDGWEKVRRGGHHAGARAGSSPREESSTGKGSHKDIIRGLVNTILNVSAVVAVHLSGGLQTLIPHSVNLVNCLNALTESCTILTLGSASLFLYRATWYPFP